MKRIRCRLSELGKAIDAVERYEKSLKSKNQRFLKELEKIGVSTADVKFKNAIYDGYNDVSVSSEWQGDNKLLIHAHGKAVAFIEFGAGIHYASPAHPLASELGMERGGYGAGHGKQDTWGYYGSPGSNGVEANDKGLVLTHGNPANRCLYETEMELFRRIEKIAREVFGS